MSDMNTELAKDVARNMTSQPGWSKDVPKRKHGIRDGYGIGQMIGVSMAQAHPLR